MKVLLSSAELFGYAKAGGLADIVYGLAKSLKGLGVDVSIVVPLYGFAKDKILGEVIDLDENLKVVREKLYGLDVFFVKHSLFDRDSIYSENGKDYDDNHLRFGLLSEAVAKIAQSFSFDIVHLNDWHTALAAYYLKQTGFDGRIAFTIHNLAYQGVFEVEPEILKIDRKYFSHEYAEFYGKLNFLKVGIAFSDRVVFVSSAYLDEVLSGEFEFGLSGFIRNHSEKIIAILNGIDYDEFNPQKDRLIYKGFSKDNLRGKYFNKQKLLSELGLKSNMPLFAFIGRFTEQKGVDFLYESLNEILKLDLNFVVLGDSSVNYKEMFESIKSDRFVALYGYNEQVARRLYAASDFIVVPSVFEPCGLVQLIAFRYGSIPVVHSVGGLKQTVHPIDSNTCGVGFVYENQTKEELLDSLEEAIRLYKDKGRLSKIRKFNMGCDFGVIRTAKEYMSLYEELLGR
ncbi:glycogen synthase [Hippea maritima]|uniref:Glycogen synthase n=1 Tax=Hippea maritima (strain ATCC 700847 / DSM 10411 / MH2) TaxID=760142 RepID=F2LVZ1_HIPMA|nr:glycogen/starch synthase [Hippea maritima]AEA33925.1 Glycogen synthase [Hippea maritima DSM 10411]